MKILFISRAYPPILGGIENQNYALSQWLPKHAETRTIANRRGRFFLPLFAPYALCVALWNACSYDVVLLGDGTLGLIGWLIKKLSKIPVASVVHGLDINWNSKSLGVWHEKILINLYQGLWVKRFLPSLDLLIAVGNETIRAGVTHSIPESKFVFIPNGVDTDQFAPKSIPKEHLGKLLKISLSGKHVLYTGGRLVKRKGVAWFIRNVLPTLPDNVLYAVSGDGPDRENVERAINEAGMAGRVFLLGYISEGDREILLNTCDLFIQPNIPVPGDMEGFGLVVLEAASVGLPVVVSRLEGLKDAIADNENGFLAEPENPESFRDTILALLGDETRRREFGVKARAYTNQHYHWEKISAQYIDVLERKISDARKNFQ